VTPPPLLQSLLQAVGVGAKRALPAAATINWVLKDGLGRLGRLTVATRFGESFDSDLKVCKSVDLVESFSF
jgi:glutamate N-acetyltransferase/amino-acid N-acetyltransferase